jgi:hypothetical protein
MMNDDNKRPENATHGTALTAKDAELYKGVNTTNPPQHAKLLHGWTPPTPPAGYRNLVAILAPVVGVPGKSHDWFLDYLDTETAVFASEEHQFDVPWPWADGFQPQPADWDAIGIPALRKAGMGKIVLG